MDLKRVIYFLAFIGTVSAFSFTKDEDPDAFKDTEEETTKRIAPPTTTTTTTTHAPTHKPIVPKIQPTRKPIVPKVPQATHKPVVPKVPQATHKPFVPKLPQATRKSIPKVQPTHKPFVPKIQPTHKPWQPKPNPTNKHWRHPKATKAPFKPVTPKKIFPTSTTTTTTRAPLPRWSYQPSYPNGHGGGYDGNGCSCNGHQFWNIPGSLNNNQSPIGIKVEPQHLRPHPDHASCNKIGWHQHAGDSRWHYHQPAVSITSNTRPDSVPNSSSKNIKAGANSSNPSKLKTSSNKRRG